MGRSLGKAERVVDVQLYTETRRQSQPVATGDPSAPAGRAEPAVQEPFTAETAAPSWFFLCGLGVLGGARLLDSTR
jgi:hypothetical protein